MNIKTLPVPDFMQKLNYTRVLIISAVLFLLGFLFGFVTPKLFKGLIKSVSEILE